LGGNTRLDHSQWDLSIIDSEYKPLVARYD
jgi:hypothetical protein